jgi:tetrahydromethanopterin S-methyltransferase subunit H
MPPPRRAPEDEPNHDEVFSSDGWHCLSGCLWWQKNLDTSTERYDRSPTLGGSGAHLARTMKVTGEDVVVVELVNEREQRLLQFRAPQEQLQIGGIKVGGPPGVRPTVLIGTIFYHGHKIVVHEGRGEFVENEAEKLIHAQMAWAERTGNPCMLDVVGATPQAMQRHLAFAASVTDMPLLIDGTTTEVRRAGLEYMARAGLADRAVYNSIQPDILDEELDAICQARVRSAIILTYYLKDFTAAGRVTAVRELVPRARKAGIDKLLIDTCVLDLATLGQAWSAIFEVKNEFGLPAGGGVHNAVAMWRGLRSKMGPEAKHPCVAAVAAASAAVGADFLLYGPIEDAPYVFPAVAMTDTALSQLAMEKGIRPEKGHPRFRVG